MSSQNFSFQIDRRRFVADRGDYYALKDKKDESRGHAQQLAQTIAKTNVEKSGLRGLESLAWSTDSVADILDYIRARVGRDTRNAWSSDNVGQQLANFLENLRHDVELFFEAHPKEMNDTQRRLLHLDLCREFIKHLVAHFEFEKSGVKHGKTNKT